MDFRDDARRILGVVNDAPGINQVKRGVSVGQSFGIKALQGALQAIQRKPCASSFDGGFGEVYTMADAARAGPLQMIGSGADTDFEHGLAMVAGELDGGVDKRLHRITVGLDLLEPLPGQRFQLPDDAFVGAAGPLLPVGAYLLVEIHSVSPGKLTPIHWRQCGCVVAVNSSRNDEAGAQSSF